MENILLILPGLSFLAFLTVINIYLSRRFFWYFSLSKIKRVYIVFASLTVFMIGGIIAFTNSTSAVGSFMYMSASIIMGLSLYLILSVLVVELIRFFVKVQPWIYGISAISMAILITGYGILNSYNIRTKEITIPIKGITNEVRAMHLTDIHIGHFRGKTFVQEIVEKTQQKNIDVVFITGDLFDGTIRLNIEAVAPLKKLDVPVYFIKGNHEGYIDFNKMKAQLKGMGIIVLENEVSFWEEFQIIGLTHMLADNKSTKFMHATGNKATIKDVLPSLNINKDIPSILLHHGPDGIKYANEHGVDLFLAGHTHASQMFPLNFVGQLIFPYNKGLHNYKGTRIYVSQGAGTFGPPLRVGTMSEITVIILEPQE